MDEASDESTVLDGHRPSPGVGIFLPIVFVVAAFLLLLVMLVAFAVGQPKRNQERSARYEARKETFYTDCLAHEPQYKCDYMWQALR